MSRSFVSPGRYLQGDDVLSELGTAATRLGSHALLVADETVLAVVGDQIEASFADTECSLTVARFNGECTALEINRLADIARGADADVVVGAGGGKTTDTAKAIRAAVGGAMIAVPTVASTDSPTSGLSVLYNSDGTLDSGIVHNQRPDLVIADTTVIANAPARFFISGIGDALATEYEAKAVAAGTGETVAGGRPTRAGLSIASECGHILLEDGEAAVQAVEADEVVPAVANVTEAIILLSGLGFENGGLAAAHAIHDGITRTVHTDTTHGEKVCVGLLAQLFLEGRPRSEIQDVASFAATIGLPTTLADIQLDASDDAQLTAVAQAVFQGESTISNQPGSFRPADIVGALRALEAL